MAAAAGRGRAARRLRADRVRRRLGRRRHPHDRPPGGRRSGWSTAPRCSSPTPAPRSPGWSPSPPAPGDDEISNLVIENGTAGYTQSAPLHKMGWRSSDTRELAFSDCRVAGGSAAGPAWTGLPPVPRDPRRRPHLGRGAGAGLRPGSVTSSRSHTPARREQFGRPIARFQAIQFKLADMATEIEAARNLVYKAAWLKDQGRPFAHTAAMAKLYTGELSRRVCNEAVQIHGGYGFMDEYAGQPVLPRPEGARDRRGHQRGAAARDRARAWACEPPGDWAIAGGVALAVAIIAGHDRQPAWCRRAAPRRTVEDSRAAARLRGAGDRGVRLLPAPPAAGRALRSSRWPTAATS